MATSYICEHSAEFAVVPYIKSLLEQGFENVVPIFPWLSREFAGKAKTQHRGDMFRVLVLFPRRPKTLDEGSVFATINYELDVFRVIGDKYDIPVIAGCPLAVDFWSLGSCRNFALLDIGYSINCAEYLIDVTPPLDYDSDLFLSGDQVIETVENSGLQDLERLERFVREVRFNQPASFFGGRYKPVYFLVR